ncbi:flagellar protein FlaG [Alkalihalophilus pseudofirmus]|uniref:flagellar protein FlaG n=1 Tax=Alkalihalophilus pseudofirmus TaxID=79885 RepID=UPI00259B8A57|nr:flagellar protein FlaG [Alkalihalophilus pseudofirmus]WEG16559.1 flagellar protein FlaG [Alkalihalophilus pseudofirmus]
MEISNQPSIKLTNSVPVRKEVPNEVIKEDRHVADVKKISNLKSHDLQQKIDGLNDFLKVSNSHLKFSLHEELNEYYVAIVDELTNEVIKEIPPKKLLDMYATMKETIGLFIDKKI